MSRKIIIGSRGSDLALWQAYFFQGQLDSIGVESELLIIKTKGDKIQHLSFDKIEGKGFFTKEIEEKLLNGEIDVAIHSHKDLETQSPEGLTIAGVSYRENPSELLLTRKECVDLELPLHFKKNAVVGTSSARRKAQVKALRPDITIKDIRGNVPTRINKLRSGDFDAILLANAGVTRLQLDLSDLYEQVLDPTLFIPAPAQGVLAYQTREGDEELIRIIQDLHHDEVKKAIDIERGILSGFGGGCHIPIGVYAEPNKTGFTVRASFAKEWEHFSKRVRFEAKDKAEALSVFQNLKEQAAPASVFYSRDLSEDSYLKRGCQQFKIDLEGKTLIATQTVSAGWPVEPFEWIFFPSSNAVEHFLKAFGEEKLEGKRLAAYGSGTASALGKYFEQVDFIGNGKSPEEVAKSFAHMVGEVDKVMFPMSTISKKSIQAALSERQVINVPVYQTISQPYNVEPKAVYIFTSPSNVESFFEGENEIAPGARVIAIGPTTGKSLADKGIKAVVADQPHEPEMFGLLF